MAEIHELAMVWNCQKYLQILQNCLEYSLQKCACKGLITPVYVKVSLVLSAITDSVVVSGKSFWRVTLDKL